MYPQIDLARRWSLAPQVAIRPEPFGALAYHFGTRRLSFLKNRTLLTIVQSLARHGSARRACTAAGVTDDQLPVYHRALTTLVASGMIHPIDGPDAHPAVASTRTPTGAATGRPTRDDGLDPHP